MDYFDPDYFDPTYFDTSDDEPAPVGRGPARRVLTAAAAPLDPDADEAYLGVI